MVNSLLLRLNRNLPLHHGHPIVAFEPLFTFDLKGHHLELVNLFSAWVWLQLDFRQALLFAALGRDMHSIQVGIGSVEEGRFARF